MNVYFLPYLPNLKLPAITLKSIIYSKHVSDAFIVFLRQRKT